jgi:hypothetical protein
VKHEYDHIYGWGNNGIRAELRGKPCAVIATGSRMFSVLLEFEDGRRIVSSIRAIRKIRPK